MAKIVIIGAGLTGLSTAYHLDKKKFNTYKIFEKETAPGGLCRSIIHKGFTFDYTGHLLHINDPYFKSFLNTILGLDQLTAINRRSFIYSNETYTHYPFQQQLYGLPADIIAQCIQGFVERKKIANPRTYLQWVQTHFGSGFAKHFFLPFQSKILAYDLDQITPSWTGRFVPNTSLKQIITGAVKPMTTHDVGYNAHFLYPRTGGIQLLPEQLARAIEQPISTEHSVQKINLKNKTIQFSNGHHENYDILINTMPLDQLLDAIEDKPTTTLKRATQNLLCNSVANFNLGLNKNISDKHWIYFPEKQFPFYRLGFAHNFTPSMAPEGCSSLYGEIGFVNKSPHYVKQVVNDGIDKACHLLNIEPKDIICSKTITIKHAYVLYTHWREKNINKIHEQLQKNNIYSIGRYGAWKYSSMEEAILDGKEIVNKICITPAKKTFYMAKATEPKQQECQT